MRVCIAASTIETPGLETRVIGLLSLLAQGRHTLVLDDPNVLEELMRFLDLHVGDAIRADYTELVEKFEVQTAWTGAATSLIIEPGSFDDYLHDLAEPARVIVEDIVSDGAFLRGLCNPLRNQRVDAALRAGHLLVEHCGGQGRVKAVIKAKAERYRRLPAMVCLIDSDRLTPSARTPSHDLADAIKADSGIHVHVLEMREAENSVPNRCLAGSARRREDYLRLNALRELSPEQRAFYDMKHGFPSTQDGSPCPSSEQQELYANVSPSVMRTLCTGFGDNLLASLERDAHALSDADFHSLGPGVLAELRRILQFLDDLI